MDAAKDRNNQYYISNGNPGQYRHRTRPAFRSRQPIARSEQPIAEDGDAAADQNALPVDRPSTEGVVSMRDKLGLGGAGKRIDWRDRVTKMVEEQSHGQGAQNINNARAGDSRPSARLTATRSAGRAYDLEAISAAEDNESVLGGDTPGRPVGQPSRTNKLFSRGTTSRDQSKTSIPKDRMNDLVLSTRANRLAETNQLLNRLGQQRSQPAVNPAGVNGSTANGMGTQPSRFSPNMKPARRLSDPRRVPDARPPPAARPETLKLELEPERSPDSASRPARDGVRPDVRRPLADLAGFAAMPDQIVPARSRAGSGRMPPSQAVLKDLPSLAPSSTDYELDLADSPSTSVRTRRMSTSPDSALAKLARSSGRPSISNSALSPGVVWPRPPAVKSEMGLQARQLTQVAQTRPPVQPADLRSAPSSRKPAGPSVFTAAVVTLSSLLLRLAGVATALWVWLASLSASMPRFRLPRPSRSTVLVMVAVMPMVWYVAEQAACSKLCRQTSSRRMVGFGVDPSAPTFPFVIPIVLARAAGIAWKPAQPTTVPWKSVDRVIFAYFDRFVSQYDAPQRKPSLVAPPSQSRGWLYSWRESRRWYYRLDPPVQLSREVVTVDDSHTSDGRPKEVYIEAT